MWGYGWPASKPHSYWLQYVTLCYNYYVDYIWLHYVTLQYFIRTSWAHGLTKWHQEITSLRRKKTSSSKWWTASWRVMRSPGTVNRTRNKSERPNQSKSQIPHDMWEHMQIPFLVLPPDAQAPTMEGIKFRVVSGTRNFAGSDNRCLVSSGLICKTWVHRALSKQTGNHLVESHSLNLGF